jgi:hypothetical protein
LEIVLMPINFGKRHRTTEEETKSGEEIAKTEEEMVEALLNKTESAADAKPKKTRGSGCFG